MVERLVHRETALPIGNLVAPQVSIASTGDEAMHELRVRIPVDLHRQLLSLKILRGRSLADTVSLALDIYFAEHAAQAAARKEAAAVGV